MMSNFLSLRQLWAAYRHASRGHVPTKHALVVTDYAGCEQFPLYCGRGFEPPTHVEMADAPVGHQLYDSAADAIKHGERTRAMISCALGHDQFELSARAYTPIPARMKLEAVYPTG